MDRKEKIKELKRKNEISIICKSWKEKGIDISSDNFLDLDETLFIQKEIIKVMDEMDEHSKSLVYGKDKEKTVNIYKQEILRIVDDNYEYIFFVKEATKHGAIKLCGKILKDNVDFIISESELFNGACCIFCCSKSIEKGLCAWLGEYDDRIYIW